MGTKVQILTALSAHKAIHSTFSYPGRMAKIMLMDHSIVKIKQTKTLPVRLTYPIHQTRKVVRCSEHYGYIESAAH